MKKLFTASMLSLAVLAGTGVMAEPRGLTSEGTGNAKAKLETGIVVEEIEGKEMDFGTLTRFGSNPAGTVSLSQSGNVTGVTGKIEQTAGTPAAGQIKISGAAGTAITSIAYTGATLSNGTKTVPLTVDGPSTADLTTGEATINVGGSLTLDGTEPDGEYSTKSTGGEAYTVTVSY